MSYKGILMINVSICTQHKITSRFLQTQYDLLYMSQI